MDNFYQKLKIANGNRHTSLSQEEGEFLYSFVKTKKIKKTLEIGLAYGVSTVYIMSATGEIHYAIDPFQNSDKYQNMGLKNIKKLGYKSRLKFFENHSAAILPQLWQKELVFEMAFMDGSHFFDDIFVDFYYLDKIIEINGWIIVHDSWTPPVKTLISWIDNNKTNYKKMKIGNGNFVALKKTGKDQRKWFEFNQFEVSAKGGESRFV